MKQDFLPIETTVSCLRNKSALTEKQKCLNWETKVPYLYLSE